MSRADISESPESAGALLAGDPTDPWYCIHTKPTQEQRANDNLADQGHAVLLPRYRAMRSNGYRFIECTRPLFPAYLFAAFDPARLAKILNTRGVQSVVTLAGNPIAVDRLVIQEIAARIGPDGLVRLHDPLGPGQKVRVVAGSFSDLEGVFVREATAQDRVWILLRILGRESLTQMDRRDVRSL